MNKSEKYCELKEADLKIYELDNKKPIGIFYKFSKFLSLIFRRRSSEKFNYEY